MMLRPDFTVPIVRLHMDAGAEPARYVYCGPVWRRQDVGSDRPREYLQAGFEVFEAGDPAAHDAEVLALIVARARRRAGRPRHRRPRAWCWRRSTRSTPATRARRRSGATSGGRRGSTRCSTASATATPPRRAAARRAARGGGRGRDARRIVARRRRRRSGCARPSEVAARVARLAAEAATPPLAASARSARLEAVLAVEGSADAALAKLARPRARAPRARRGGRPLRRAARRARRRAGIAAGGAALRGELRAHHARILRRLRLRRAAAAAAPDLPPIASGGRYDALTRVLGQRAGHPGRRRHRPPRGAGALREGAYAAEARGAVEGAAAGGDDRLVRRPRRHAGAQRRRARVPRHASRASTGVELVLLSAGEIPRELAAGRLHLGVTGQDLVREEIPRWRSGSTELAPMGFGFADLVVAVPAFWIDVARHVRPRRRRRRSSAPATATGCGSRPSTTTWSAPSSSATASPTTSSSTARARPRAR